MRKITSICSNTVPVAPSLNLVMAKYKNIYTKSAYTKFKLIFLRRERQTSTLSVPLKDNKKAYCITTFRHKHIFQAPKLEYTQVFSIVFKIIAISLYFPHKPREWQIQAAEAPWFLAQWVNEFRWLVVKRQNQMASRNRRGHISKRKVSSSMS